MDVAEVSVIIPCYNCTATIGRAVESVFNQTLRPAEVIVVNDASRDNTLELLYGLQKRFGDQWLQVRSLPVNKGAGAARNVGWDIATQQYLAFLDADDAWHPEKIAVQLEWMNLHPDAALTGHKFRFVSNRFDWQSQAANGAVRFELIAPRRMLFSNLLPARSVMLRRLLPYRFSETKRYSEDYLLWCEICLDGNKCYLADSELVYTFRRKHERAGLSGDLLRMQRGELDTLLQLYKNGRIGTAVLPLIMVWSILKFFRRVLLAAFVGLARRMWSI